MNEFVGNVMGTNDHWFVTASCGRNFVPQERMFSKESVKRLMMAIDFASVMAFVVLTFVLSF